MDEPIELTIYFICIHFIFYVFVFLFNSSPKNGYYKMGRACEPCPENDIVLILIICALVIVVLIMLLFIYKIAQSKLPLAPIASAIRHMQFMSFFIQINLPYPPFLLSIYNYLTSIFSFNIADMTSPECIVETSYLQEWVVYTSGPLLVVSLIILWAAFGDPVIVACKIWYQKRRGAFEQRAFGRTRSQVRKSPRRMALVHPRNKTKGEKDSEEEEEEENEDGDDVRRSAGLVKKDFERDAERKELETGIAKSRQTEHTLKRLEERKALKMEQDHEHMGDSGGAANGNKKLSRLEKRR